jgi:hypothetical protein
MKEASAAAQVCPGIRIHVIDIDQPPGIGISSIADIDAHQARVADTLRAKSNAEMPRKAFSEARAEWLEGNVVGIIMIAPYSVPFSVPLSVPPSGPRSGPFKVDLS